MPEYDNTNRGVLFINDRKEKDSQPDRTGRLNVDGVEYWLDGWIKSKDGKQYLSLSVKPKEQQGTGQAPRSINSKPVAQNAARPQPSYSGPHHEPLAEDDIPF